MKSRELKNLGLAGRHLRLAQTLCRDAARAGLNKQEIRTGVVAAVETPESESDHKWFGELAKALRAPEPEAMTLEFNERAEPAAWQQWGDDLDEASIAQMRNACRLPVAVRGALMPDAHVGYGLPIGGVLATENAVIPFAVGVDIACRMRLTVTDMPTTAIKGEFQRLVNAIEEETRFGIGASFQNPRDHEVMDEDWDADPITRKLKQKAQRQLGTSGSGNHFVEFGTLTLDKPDLGLQPGTYLALLSHSGSRGAGATVANHYSKLAQRLHPELPRELSHLAWLDLDSEEGQAYWAAMQLMGQYAAANHAVIHRELVRHLKCKALATVENHHNFAWKEKHIFDGQEREVYVHRKGATPAGKGVLGVIPGSMATPGYVVRGRGNAPSLESAAHGAGRVMSRTRAKNSLTWSDAKKRLANADVHLISAGLDEVPDVYKDINTVMSHQDDLVEIVARFNPRIVKMAPEGERPED